jgi:hypothetical protein
MKAALLELLEELEDIGNEDEQIFDSEVREVIGDAIFLALVKAEPGYALPTSFGMGPDLDARVYAAVQSFVSKATVEANQAGLRTFKARLLAFQDSSVITDEGNDFEDFFGAADPDDFDDAGNVKQR